MSRNENLLKLINGDSFRTYNVFLAKKLGSINSAILLAELVNRENYHNVRGELIESDGSEWFYYTHEMGEDRLGMTRREQDSALKNLIDTGLVVKKVFGVPAKRCFSMCEDIINVYIQEASNVN